MWSFEVIRVWRSRTQLLSKLWGKAVVSAARPASPDVHRRGSDRRAQRHTAAADTAIDADGLCDRGRPEEVGSAPPVSRSSSVGWLARERPPGRTRKRHAKPSRSAPPQAARLDPVERNSATCYSWHSFTAIRTPGALCCRRKIPCTVYDATFSLYLTDGYFGVAPVDPDFEVRSNRPVR